MICLRLPAEMVVSQSFAFVDRAESLSRMNLALRRMRASDDEALSLRRPRAGQGGCRRARGLGEHHLSVTVRGASQREVDAAAAEAQAALADLGVVSVREELGLEPAFWAQFPGNFNSSRGAALSPPPISPAPPRATISRWGQAAGNHWGRGGFAVQRRLRRALSLNSPRRPIFGNFTVIGPSGSGRDGDRQFPLGTGPALCPAAIVFSTRTVGPSCSSARLAGLTTCCAPGCRAG